MSAAARHQQIIEEKLKHEMLAVDRFVDGEDVREAILKHTWEVVEDDENAGLFEGDEGEVRASVVGAPEYGNERVTFSLHTEDHTDGVECRPLDNVQPVD